MNASALLLDQSVLLPDKLNLKEQADLTILFTLYTRCIIRHRLRAAIMDDIVRESMDEELSRRVGEQL